MGKRIWKVEIKLNGKYEDGGYYSSKREAIAAIENWQTHDNYYTLDPKTLEMERKDIRNCGLIIGYLKTGEVFSFVLKPFLVNNGTAIVCSIGREIRRMERSKWYAS